MKAVKIGIIFLALGAAIVITLFFGDAEEAPNDAITITQWKCVECEHSFELNAAALDREYSKTEGKLPLYCPKCGKQTAYQPMACLRCNTLFFGPEVPGQPGICPVCKPEDQVPPVIEEEQPKPDPSLPPELQPERPRPRPKSV